MAEVPVIRFEHLSEAQKRAYLIANNQLALQAGWSEELLAQELAWLRDERSDLDLVGFDASELERLLAIADGVSEDTEDVVPEPPQKPVSSWFRQRRSRGCKRGVPLASEHAFAVWIAITQVSTAEALTKVTRM